MPTRSPYPLHPLHRLTPLLPPVPFLAALQLVAVPQSSSRPKGGLIAELRQALGGPQEAARLMEALKPDYWRIKSVVQAADAVMWPSQVAGMPSRPTESTLFVLCSTEGHPARTSGIKEGPTAFWNAVPTPHTLFRYPAPSKASPFPWHCCCSGEVAEQDWKWWSDELKALDDKLGRAPQAAGVRKMLSAIKNNHGGSVDVVMHVTQRIIMLCPSPHGRCIILTEVQ
jgi:hypothetical protein